ncbi:MAG: outer membrane protein assembly factor BamE [Pseudomonadota bacterium]
MSAKHRYSIRSVLEVSALTVFASVALTACSSFSGTSTSAINPVNWLTPYKVDVIQGNFVSKEQIEVLKPGMTRNQVKDVLGTPLITSVFHADRWDYVFTLKRQGVQPQAYKYTVFFKGDLLERFEGDTMPSEEEFISKLDNSRKLGKVPALEATEEQLKNAEKTGVAKASSTESMPSGSPTAPSTTVYPPLESARP